MTDDPWTRSIAWAMAQNVILFALLGAVAYLTYARPRVDRALEAHPPPLDLVDPSGARALAATGLRRSFFWIVGGSFASLVLVDLDFSWMTGVVVLVTLAVKFESIDSPTDVSSLVETLYPFESRRVWMKWSMVSAAALVAPRSINQRSNACPE